MHVLQDMRGDHLTRYLSELRRRISAPTSAPSGSTHQVSSLDRTGSEERRLSESGVSMTYVGGKSAEVFFPPTTTTVAVRFVAPSRSLPPATVADVHAPGCSLRELRRSQSSQYIGLPAHARDTGAQAGARHARPRMVSLRILFL